MAKWTLIKEVRLIREDNDPREYVEIKSDGKGGEFFARMFSGAMYGSDINTYLSAIKMLRRVNKSESLKEALLGSGEVSLSVKQIR